MQPISIRLDGATVHRLETLAALQAKRFGNRCTRADVIRRFVLEGLARERSGAISKGKSKR